MKYISFVFPAALIIFFFSAFSFNKTETSESAMQENSISLPSPNTKGSMSLEEAISKRRSVRNYRGDALNLAQVGQILWSAQGITLSSRGYRAIPSAGATFPLEIYLLAGRVSRLQPGLYRYIPSSHSLVKVKDGDIRESLAGAALGQHMIQSAPASFIISADYERTAKRYGDRATRYVHIEVGHAGQNISLQAISLGYASVMIGAFQDENVKAILELPANEEPLYIIPVGKPN